jgi:hypothetical protein
MSQEPIETANQSTDQRRVEHSGETVLLSSGKTAWEGILLEHIHLPASDISDVTAMSHHLTLQLGTSKTVELKVNGKFSRQQMIPGNICITPVQHLHAIRWQSDMEVLAMTLEPTPKKQLE